jgi:mRNA deadenylase 3'-5' endonuclease subunit Ccr4
MKKRKNKSYFTTQTTKVIKSDNLVELSSTETASSFFCCSNGGTEIDLKEFKFEVCTYNLLAPALAEENNYLYSNVPNDFIDWYYRRSKILEEVKHFDFDVSI